MAMSYVHRGRQQARLEHYWLCDECAAQWTLTYDPERGISLVPVRRPAASIPEKMAVMGSGVA